MELQDLLKELIEKKGSDLHLSAGSPPLLRRMGRLEPVGNGVLSPPDTERLIYSILTRDQRSRFEEEMDLDFSVGIGGVGRFRGNVHRQRGSVSAVFRHLPDQIPALQELGLPPVVQEIARKTRGLVLVTGPTGSGKSTTMASIVQFINQSRACHVVILEDPIEFLHKNQRALIKQREIGSDTKSYAAALRHVARQDPDVIVVGEMRDAETIEGALHAAETGRLVIGTLHTADAVQAVERIVDAFPAYQHDQIRSSLAATLEAVISQHLLPRKDGAGRIAAFEILLATPGVRNLIRQAKPHQIYSDLETGSRLGMQSVNQALFCLCQKNLVDPSEAMARSPDPKTLSAKLTQAGLLK